MLSTTNPSSSSIQRRRQMHRRQNSLEVPMLATPLPSASRRPQGAQHRRGLSLEQGMSSLLPRQEVSIPANQRRPQSQHSVQETQQHRPYQPGFFPMEPSQQQQFFKQEIAPAEQQQHFYQVKPEVAPAEQAIKNLEDHIQSVYRAYGYVPQTNVPQPQSQPQLQVPNTPIIVATPNTPPSSYGHATPMSNRHGRAERALLDVSPMPTSFSNVPLVQIQEAYPSQDTHSIYAESFAGDYACTPSYASSLVDPSSPIRSPIRQMNAMPTVFEALSPAPSQATFAQDSMYFPSSSSPYYPASPQRMVVMSPREAMLQTMDIDASIEDTGISAEEVQRYISHQDVNDGKWTCLFDGCNKKFGRKENIRSHVQTHLGDRQFKCNHCGKCFVRQHDLKRHAKIHSGDKPHKCPCGNGFARQDALTRHRQRGVCPGALPGFERRDVRRGRPRKTRPDMVDRVEKASRARNMDARRDSQDTYASSSASERSYPDTPQQVSDDFDDDAFANLTDDAKFDAFGLSRYTPPTSPFSTGASPVKHEMNLNSGYQTAVPVLARAPSPRSSPPTLPQSPPSSAHLQNVPFGTNNFDFSGAETKTNEFIQVDVFSPTVTSSSGSDFDHFSPPATTGAESAFMGSEDILEFDASMYGPSDSLFNNSLDAWLESH